MIIKEGDVHGNMNNFFFNISKAMMNVNIVS